MKSICILFGVLFFSFGVQAQSKLANDPKKVTMLTEITGAMLNGEHCKRVKEIYVEKEIGFSVGEATKYYDLAQFQADEDLSGFLTTVKSEESLLFFTFVQLLISSLDNRHFVD